MGYYTRFELEVKLPDGKKAQKKQPPCVTCKRPFEFDKTMDLIRATDTTYGNLGELMDQRWDSVKWYDHETEMKAISLTYPGVLFTMKGEGEEAGDIWTKYFIDGKMQVSRAEIKIDGFDPGKLK